MRRHYPRNVEVPAEGLADDPRATARHEAGHDFEKIVYGKGKPVGLFTGGTRPELEETSGQEKLPVLQFPDGGTVSGGSGIVNRAKANAPTQATSAGCEGGGP